MITKKGWNQELMMSLWKKEATYDAAVTINATNFVSMRGYTDYDPEWGDEVIDDLDTVSGSEHATEQEINTQGFKFTYEEPRARPNSVIGMVYGAFGIGSLTALQDGGFNAWRHLGSPVAVGTALPSFNIVAKKGGLQYLHKGCMVNSVELSSEEGGGVKLAAEIIGSGTRATDATGFVAKLAEPRLFARHIKIFREDGANISIDATPTQGTENISSATPDTLSPRVTSWRWKYLTNVEGQRGHGSAVFQDMDYSRRAVEFSMTLRHNDNAELDQYLAQTNLAFEIDCTTTSLVAAGGAFYSGVHIVVPSAKIKKTPWPKGGVGDVLTTDIEVTLLDNGTNPISIFAGYSAKSAYFAA